MQKATPGLLPCEGRGPQLCGVYTDDHFPGVPLIIHVHGKKIYVVNCGDGCLVLAEEDNLAKAVELLTSITSHIKDGEVVGSNGTDLVWAVTTCTAESFKQWTIDIVSEWRAQNP